MKYLVYKYHESNQLILTRNSLSINIMIHRIVSFYMHSSNIQKCTIITFIWGEHRKLSTRGLDDNLLLKSRQPTASLKIIDVCVAYRFVSLVSKFSQILRSPPWRDYRYITPVSQMTTDRFHLSPALSGPFFTHDLSPGL